MPHADRRRDPWRGAVARNEAESAIVWSRKPSLIRPNPDRPDRWSEATLT
jgi:hypothetical protein